MFELINHINEWIDTDTVNFFPWSRHANYLVQWISAVSQSAEGCLSGHCPLCSPGATADRQLLLWTETLNAGRVRSMHRDAEYGWTVKLTWDKKKHFCSWWSVRGTKVTLQLTHSPEFYQILPYLFSPPICVIVLAMWVHVFERWRFWGEGYICLGFSLNIHNLSPEWLTLPLIFQYLYFGSIVLCTQCHNLSIYQTFPTQEVFQNPENELSLLRLFSSLQERILSRHTNSWRRYSLRLSSRSRRSSLSVEEK